MSKPEERYQLPPVTKRELALILFGLRQGGIQAENFVAPQWSRFEHFKDVLKDGETIDPSEFDDAADLLNIEGQPRQYQLPKPSPDEITPREDCVTISGSHGELQVLKKNGQVLHWYCPEGGESLDAYADILHFDVKEYVEWWGELDDTDILLIGYWYIKDGLISYEPPVAAERNCSDRKLSIQHRRREEALLHLSREDVIDPNGDIEFELTGEVWDRLVDSLKEDLNEGFLGRVREHLETVLHDLALEKADGRA